MSIKKKKRKKSIEFYSSGVDEIFFFFFFLWGWRARDKDPEVLKEKHICKKRIVPIDYCYQMYK